MAEAKKPKAIRYTTPKGTFAYPYLVKADFGNKSFPDPAGTFKVNLRLTEDEAAPLLAALQPIFDQAVQDGEQEFAKLKVDVRKKLKSLTVTPLFVEEYDEATEEPTGNITFKFATKASGKNAKGEEWTRTIPLFDAAGKPIKPTMVGGGTVGKVSFECSPYFIPGTGVAGVKLYLVAAQILELSEAGSGGSSSSYGFGAEEGYEAPDDSSGDFTPDNSAADDGSNDKF
jgi:hypothetical protein